MQSRYHISDEQRREEMNLVARASKDNAAFAILYERYHSPILNFVYQRLDDKQTAADITSQVFCKALLNLKKFKDKGVPFSSWLYRIARNELLKFFEKNKSRRTVNIDTQSFPELSSDMEADNKESMYEALANCIAELPEEELQLIEMRYFDGLKFKEIGEILDMTENNAKVRCYRVLDKIKAMVKPEKF